MAVPKDHVAAAKAFLYELADRSGLDVSVDVLMELQSMLEEGLRILVVSEDPKGHTVAERLYQAVEPHFFAGLESDAVINMLVAIRSLQDEGWIFIPPN